MKKTLLKESLLFGKIFFGLILALVIVVSVFPLVPPFKNYYHSRTVLTGSMEPKIPKGSVVINQWADQKNLKVGDVITYQHPSDKKIVYITHRIVKIDETGLLWRFETKGDANPAADFGLVTQAGTEGKVIFTIPLIGYLIELFKTPIGFILLVALPLLIFIIQQIRDVLKIWKKRNVPSAMVLIALSFLAARAGLVTYASFTSGQATITGVTLSTAASDWTPPSASLSITGSFTKSVTEKVSNGDFEEGLTGWTTAGNVQLLSTDNIASPSTTINPYEGNKMVRIGNPDDPGNYVWENRLMGSFDSGAKSLSLNYNFFSRDYTPFDDPGFFIRLNGQEIFKLNTLSVNPDDEIDGLAYYSDWQEFYYDLSNLTDSKVNLSLYAGNTGYGDKDVQSWVYIDKITTYFVSAPAHAVYTLSGEDNLGGSGISHFEYNINDAGWSTGNTFGGVPPLSNGGTHTVQYRSVDNAGNSSPIYTVKIITDTEAPADIIDLQGDEPIPYITENSVLLTWTAPGNDGVLDRASQYDIRYSSTATDCSGFNFDTATKVEKVPSPQEAGKTETLEILGLNPLTKYCFAIKTADEAPNWSGFATVSATTLPISYTVNAGDIVINELMWMGSSASDADEWLELRNMTDRTIVLSGFSLTKFDGTNEVPMVISFAGKSIAPQGYLLIANSNSYSSGTKDSQLKNTITPDIWDSSLDLSDTKLEINLYWNDGVTNYLIDTAWNGETPTEGLNEAEKYYSMERTSVPGDGTIALNWYTCIDTASTLDFFDGGADERGTPGAVNRSENEPLAHQSLIPRITPTPTPTPSPTPEISPTPTPTVEPSLTPAPSTASTPSPSPEVSPTPTPEPTTEPTPTLTPTPSPTSEV